MVSRACLRVSHTSVRVCACLLHVPCLIPRHARDVPRVTWCMRRGAPGNLSAPHVWNAVYRHRSQDSPKSAARCFWNSCRWSGFVKVSAMLFADLT